jgi:tRNA threonylcarbamoyladenosine modification (KEOPS) complex Cgi121 subunit
MLKYIEEAEKYLEITGFRNLGIEDAEEFVKATRKVLPENAWIQFFDAGLVATWQHLYFAVLNALMAFRNGWNISKSVAMETMLYASARRQIQKAIDFMGVKCASADVAVVIIGESAESVKAVLSEVSKCVGEEPDDSVLEISKDKVDGIRDAFRITDVELEAVLEKDDGEDALVDRVIERVALLPTQM